MDDADVLMLFLCPRCQYQRGVLPKGSVTQCPVCKIDYVKLPLPMKGLP